MDRSRVPRAAFEIIETGGCGGARIIFYAGPTARAAQAPRRRVRVPATDPIQFIIWFFFQDKRASPSFHAWLRYRSHHKGCDPMRHPYPNSPAPTCFEVVYLRSTFFSLLFFFSKFDGIRFIMNKLNCISFKISSNKWMLRFYRLISFNAQSTM